MISISVAMATYNGARFLREQLDSIVAQTVLPAELVITDDASSDGTLAILDEFARTAPFPVHIYRNPSRLGYRANFMRNAGLCTSQLVALCDQDDIWDSRKLETLRKSFADPDVLLAFHEAWLIDIAGVRTGLAEIYVLPKRNPPLSLFPMRNPYGFSMMFDRRLSAFSDLWERSIDDYETGNRMAHDQWFFFLASVFGTIMYLEEPLASYRQHDTNTYGVANRPRSIFSRTAAWIAQTFSVTESFCLAASMRAQILEDAHARLNGRWAGRAHEAAVSYRHFGHDLTLRSAAYRTTAIVPGVRAWVGMVRKGVYGGRLPWGRSWKTAIKDLAYMVGPARFIRALATPRHVRAKQRDGTVKEDIRRRPETCSTD